MSIIERDPAPPDISPELAFEAWDRPGVPQFRHAHIMLARIQTTLRDRHPVLLQQLLDAGLYFSTVEEILPPSHYRGIQPEKGDGDLLHLWGRRATFEYVVRRYVERLPHVQFIHEARVVGLVSAVENDRLTVSGVEIATEGEWRETITADIVVDASGVRSRVPDWLEAAGVEIPVESHPSGFVYACRHYHLNEPENAPPREQGGGNFDYLGYATFYQERGHFALTLCCPEEETELSELVRRPDGFEALCAQLPTLRLWTSRATPTTKVLGAGRFENRWRRFETPTGRAIIGLFAVGDSQVQTNPMYGRGCASAFVQATALADTLTETADPAERARRYYLRSRKALQPYFELSVATDRMYRTRANLRRGGEISGGERLLNYAYERAFLPATYRYPLMAREFLRSIQMREISAPWIRLAAVWLVVAAWFQNLVRPMTVPNQAPPREEFLRRLRVRDKPKPTARPLAELGLSDQRNERSA
ncbi:MAG: hypothetical protein ABW321_00005 [Polyangiales bacterium]